MIEILHAEDSGYPILPDKPIIVLTSAKQRLTLQCAGITTEEKERLAQKFATLPNSYYPDFLVEITTLLEQLGWKETTTIYPDYYSDHIFRKKN